MSVQFVAAAILIVGGVSMVAVALSNYVIATEPRVKFLAIWDEVTNYMVLLFVVFLIEYLLQCQRQLTLFVPNLPLVVLAGIGLGTSLTWIEKGTERICRVPK